MVWDLPEASKYWKYSSVLSGTISFVYLIQAVTFLMIFETLKQLIPFNYFSIPIWIFLESSIPAIFFILFFAGGILASRGNVVGVILNLILSSIIILIIVGLSIFIFILTMSPIALIAFVILFCGSPQAILSVFNIYYSVRALRNRIQEHAISICRFFACSLQYATAIIVVIFAFFAIFFAIIFQLAGSSGSLSTLQEILPMPLPELAVSVSVILLVSFILLYLSGNHIFKNDEETLSKKFLYVIASVSVLLLLSIAVLVPFIGPSIGLLTIPFIVASIGFIAAVPRRESVIGFSERAIVPRPINREYIARRGHPYEEEGVRYPAPSDKLRAGEKKYCRYCGRRIPADSIFCEYCGRRLRWNAD